VFGLRISLLRCGKRKPHYLRIRSRQKPANSSDATRYTGNRESKLATDRVSIPLEDQVVIDTATDGSIHERRTTVESMSVGGLTVPQMDVYTLDPKVLSLNHQPISGILRESFLKHFDILLDNEKKILVLDRTSRLSESLAGEQLPFPASASAMQVVPSTGSSSS
jgi:hypothetical protein